MTKVVLENLSPQKSEMFPSAWLQSFLLLGLGLHFDENYAQSWLSFVKDKQLR